MNTKKTKKNGFRYLTSSILLLFVAFLLAVTATLAWFSMNISSRVSGILFEVTTQENLLIAVKQWKHRQVEATRVETERIEAVFDGESDGYVYSFDNVQRIAQTKNIQNYNGKNYVFVSTAGDEIDPQWVVADGSDFFVYYNDGLAIDATLYSEVEMLGENYLLSGFILEEPEYEDYTNEITEAQLAKVCMNDKDASAITDALTCATTRKNEDGTPSSITSLVSVTGDEYRPNSLAGGGRFTTSVPGMPDSTAFKYEFDLYFMSETDFSVVLNTLNSSIRSEPNNGAASYDVSAWRRITIDEHTTDVNLKNYYGSSIGSRETVPEGVNIFAQAKNAMRVGFSDADSSAIAIWDPHASFGWTINDPSGNLALEYYNLASGFNAQGSPATATLTSQTNLIKSMTKQENGKFTASIKVTIWLEGFDGDCFDSLMSETLKFRLNFAGQLPK